MSDIVLKNVKKSFGANEVIKDFSHTFAGGCSVAVMGASGAGKTTLINMIMGLCEPDSGEIIIPSGERFSCVFQEDRLIEHLNAIENIRLVFNREIDYGAIREEFKCVGIGTEDPEELKKPLSQFSGGMKRRVAIVRAMMAETDTVILDEPFKGLDEKLKKEVMDYVDDKIGASKLILITHDPDEAEYLCDEIIRIS